VSGETAGEQRRLVLLRHAKAEHHGGVSDEMRTLTPAGRRQAAHVGALLAEAGLEPDVVLCSVAVRTRQTYELLASALAAAPAAEYSEDLYDAGISGTLAVISEGAGDARTVLVVGHEPVMSGVAASLAGPGSDPTSLARVRVGLPTGGLAVLELASSWRELRRGAALLTKVLVAPHHG
jgi:phosphohistidine phosphatase